MMRSRFLPENRQMSSRVTAEGMQRPRRDATLALQSRRPEGDRVRLPRFEPGITQSLAKFDQCIAIAKRASPRERSANANRSVDVAIERASIPHELL
jgi:hypothetical protein